MNVITRNTPLTQVIDDRVTEWMQSNATRLLRISLGIVFLWFGALKFFPGVSPAEALAGDTLQVITFGWIPRRLTLLILATWECAIGIGFVTGRALRLTLVLLFLQMLGTLTPLLIFTALCFKSFPLVLTFEGQYIVKNLVLMSAALAIGGSLHCRDCDR